ncbi:MAG: hypothetical protein WBA35_01120, partial [Litorimonas sp.]
HGTDRLRRDPENILLDAILIMASDAVGARARLSWLAERDGPEQLVAIDLLRRGDSPLVARSELRRLSDDSPDDATRLSAQERLLAHAVEDADLALVAEMITTNNNLANDEASRARLVERLTLAVSDPDPETAVRAMDIIHRMEAKGVVFTDALDADVQARTAALASGVRMDVRMAADTTTDPAADPATGKASSGMEEPAPNRPAPDRPDPDLPAMTGSDVQTYLDTLSDDMTRFEEVLRRG